MAAYLVVLGRINDQERFAKYFEGVGASLAPYGAELLGLEDPAEVIEGEAPYPRLVLAKFPSKEHVRNWKNSEEYKTVAEHRLASSDHVFY